MGAGRKLEITSNTTYCELLKQENAIKRGEYWFLLKLSMIRLEALPNLLTLGEVDINDTEIITWNKFE